MFSDFHLLQETKLLIVFSVSYSAATEIAAYNLGIRDMLSFSWRGLRHFTKFHCFFMSGAEVFNGFPAALHPTKKLILNI